MNRHALEVLLHRSLRENWPGSRPNQADLSCVVAAAACELYQALMDDKSRYNALRKDESTCLGDVLRACSLPADTSHDVLPAIIRSLVAGGTTASDGWREALRELEELKKFDVRKVTYYGGHPDEMGTMRAPCVSVEDCQGVIDHRTELVNKLQGENWNLKSEVDQARTALGGFGGAPFDGSLKGGIDAISMRCAAAERRTFGLEVELKDEREKLSFSRKAVEANFQEAAKLRDDVRRLEKDLKEFDVRQVIYHGCFKVGPEPLLTPCVSVADCQKQMDHLTALAHAIDESASLQQQVNNLREDVQIRDTHIVRLEKELKDEREKKDDHVFLQALYVPQERLLAAQAQLAKVQQELTALRKVVDEKSHRINELEAAQSQVVELQHKVRRLELELQEAISQSADETLKEMVGRLNVQIQALQRDTEVLRLHLNYAQRVAEEKGRRINELEKEALTSCARAASAAKQELYQFRGPTVEQVMAALLDPVVAERICREAIRLYLEGKKA